MHTLCYLYNMKIQYDFSSEKNQKLIQERGISFEEVITAIAEGAVLDILLHPNQIKYPGQQMYILNIRDYAYVVPFIQQDKNTVFLKTIFPNRKFTEQYLGDDNEKET
jgi:hypothetical protein